MRKNNSNKFFMISFLPAIAYWYLESRYPIRVAVAGGLILSILEITLEKIIMKHVHKISILNFFLILFLGGLSLLGDEGIWFKLQPLFTGVFMSSFMFWRLNKGNGLLYEMMETMDTAMFPLEAFKPTEWHMAFFLLIYGIFMGIVAITQPTSVWAFFKLAGFYGVFFIFMVIEFILMRKRMKRLGFKMPKS